MGEGSALVEGWAVGPVFAVGRPQDHHAVLVAAGVPFLGQEGDVAEGAAPGVGVDVEVVFRVPCERVPVTATVVEPGGVVGIGTIVFALGVGPFVSVGFFIVSRFFK